MTSIATVNEQEDKVERFVDYLEKLEARGDRAAMAALRRSLGKPIGLAGEAHRHVLWINPAEWEEPIYYLIAGLFALHPSNWKRAEEDRRTTNLGDSFARLKAEVDSSSIERRFVAILDSHEDDLAEHLRHAVSLLKSRDIPVDWKQLLRDIRGWRYESRNVQRQWARAFWS
jgi:CRISPR system Cascade subunit CasB